MIVGWWSQGLVEKLLLGTAPIAHVAVIALRRHPRAERACRWAFSALWLGLGSLAAGDRLAHLGPSLAQVDHRDLVAAVARGEYLAASVLGMACGVAASLGLWSSLLRCDTQAARIPAIAAASSLALAAAAAHRDLMTLAEPSRDVPLVSIADPAAAGVIALAMIAGVVLLGRNTRRATFVVLVAALVVAWPLANLGAALALEPTLPTRAGRVRHPGGEANRVAGGCLLERSKGMWTASPAGMVSEPHGLVGCSSPVGSFGARDVLLLAIGPDEPLAAIQGLHAAGGGMVHLLTSLTEEPDRWLATRWALPLWPAPESAVGADGVVRWRFDDPMLRPVKGSVVVTLEPLVWHTPHGRYEGLSMFNIATQHQRRFEVLVVAGQSSVTDLTALCSFVVQSGELGARCGLALGPEAAWTSWAATSLGG
jgi:hypothetical protein